MNHFNIVKYIGVGVGRWELLPEVLENGKKVGHGFAGTCFGLDPDIFVFGLVVVVVFARRP